MENTKTLKELELKISINLDVDPEINPRNITSDFMQDLAG
jgi:hypothetical protein